MSRARELSRLGNTNVITADTSFNVGLGTEVPTNPATSANTQIVSAGIVSAYQLYGDGSALTGVAATDNINTNNIEVSGITTLGSTVTVGSAVTFQNNSGINVTGVITATSFDGDGSALTGLPAGLGTALATSGAGANIYYTNKVLSIESNLTTDIPSTSDLGYTQYEEIAVASGVELTVGDGDQLVPDILGLTTSLGASSLTGGGGAVRADNFTNKTGGAPTFPDGINVTAGVGTFAGNVSIAGTLTYEDVTNVDSVGVITARTGLEITAGTISVGSGATITDTGYGEFAGIVTSNICFKVGNGPFGAGIGVTITGDGNANFIGIVTASSYEGDGSSLTGIEAGITTESNSVSSGYVTINLNKDDHKVTASGVCTVTCTTTGTEGGSGTLRITNSGITTIGFSTYFLWPSGGAPSIPTTDGTISLISYTINRNGSAGIATQLLAGASLNFS